MGSQRNKMKITVRQHSKPTSKTDNTMLEGYGAMVSLMLLVEMKTDKTILEKFPLTYT